jgi:HemY protein
VQLQDWQSLEKILPVLRRQKSLSEVELNELESLLFGKLLTQASQKDFSAESIQAVWKRVPKSLQRNAALVNLYVGLLEADDELMAAESILRKTLQKSWDDSLAIRYGLLKPVDAGRQLLHAEGWLKERPGNGCLMLTLGRLALRNELWGKARDYFDSSLKIQATPEACAELARLLAHLNEHEASVQYYQQGLLLTANQLPELPLP